MDRVRVLERQCRALSQRRRLRILLFLKKHRHGTIGELSAALHCTIATVSQHLRILREEEIVIDRRRGMYVVYVLSPRMSDIARTVLRAL